jgi:P4 family phage/plasmid primase-like protien
MEARYTTGANWNITGMAQADRGKFAISDEDYDTFLETAHDHIFVKNRACSLLEKHLPQGPILIDLDFKYAAGGPLRRRFTTEQVRRFVAAYADAFSHFYELPDRPMEFFVMLKPSAEVVSGKEQHKDGVHIVCPSVTTIPEIQFAIRGWMLQNNVIQNIFGETGMTNEALDCFDLSVISRNNWFIYGGGKQDKASYKVEQVYSLSTANMPEDGPVDSEHLEEMDIDNWTSKSLIKLLSIRHGHNKVTELLLLDEHKDEWQTLLDRWGQGSNWAPKSPGLHAKKGGNVPSLHLGNPVVQIQGAAPEMVQISGVSVRSKLTPEDIRDAYRLARECLNPEKRAKNYCDWVSLGMLLNNISPSKESCDVWASISRRAPGNENTPDSIYETKWKLLPAEAAALQRGRKPLMMGTLHLWAREDNPALYRAISDENNIECARINDSGTHVSVADLVLCKYRHDFRCTPSKKSATASSMDWFRFIEHSWSHLKTWMTIRTLLSNDVRNVYCDARTKVSMEIRNLSPDKEEERPRLEQKVKNMGKVLANLQNCSFKDSVMREVAEKFYVEDFLQHMNMDGNTLGFANGVLELRTPGEDGQFHVKFRPGRPDDCISFQMGRSGSDLEAIPYLEYDPAHPQQEHKEVFEFFKQIYPDEVLREFVLTLFASCLEGANREQKFYIMTGVGSNGKSKMVDLMNFTFGEYQDTLSTTVLTRKRPESGAANPDLIVLKGKRFISMSEPDDGEKINTSAMKQVSGEDIVKARALFSDQDQFKIMGKIFMLCNDLPPVSSMDNGTWRRLRVIPHVARFVDIGVATDPANHVHTKDLMMDNKIRRWRPYFAGILVHYYETRYLRNGLSDPPQVLAASNKYKEDNDAFAAFAQERLIREVGAEVKAMEIMTAYSQWCKYNPGKKVLKKQDLLQRMSDVYGKPVDAAGRMYAGVRLVDDGEDISGNIIS